MNRLIKYIENLFNKFVTKPSKIITRTKTGSKIELSWGFEKNHQNPSLNQLEMSLKM